MPDPNFLLLYVADPAASAAFYRGLLGRRRSRRRRPLFCLRSKAA